MFRPAVFVLFAGLAATQPPPGAPPADDVTRVAKRLLQLDPAGSLPFKAEDIDRLRKLLDQNPALKTEVRKFADDLRKLPAEQRDAKLAELEAAKTDPKVQDQLRKAGRQLGQPDSAADAPPQAGAGPPKSDAPPPPATPPAEAVKPPKVDLSKLPQGGRPLDGKGVKGFDKFAALWEKNVGPLKNTPAVQKLALELFRGRPDPAAGGGGPLDKLFDAKAVGDLLNGLPEADRSGWALPDLGEAGGFQPPALAGGGFGVPSLGGVGPAGGAGLLAVLMAAAVWYLSRLKAAAGDPRAVPGLGPWPLDPRAVRTAGDVVQAFEYLSVLLNGLPARAYSHEAAAAALQKAVPDAADAAGPLAELYALARYAPAAPLTAEDIAAARGHLCRLAGVPAP